MAKQIDLKDVDVYYGDFLAVEDVTLTIPARAVTAFIGPSGWGSRRSCAPSTGCTRWSRVSDQTAFFNVTRAGGPGHLVEVGDTAQLFAHPLHPSTEDYVRGRFG